MERTLSAAVYLPGLDTSHGTPVKHNLNTVFFNYFFGLVYAAIMVHILK